MSNKFLKARAIYPSKYLNKMNISLFFVYEGELEKNTSLKITGNSCYRIFDNGKLVGVGPARAAHGYFRIDEFEFLEGHHRVVIELSGYNCCSYYFLDQAPFLQAEFIEDDKVIAYTGDNNFKCYKNDTRYEILTRFSYQRTFAEAYKMNIDLDKFLNKDNSLTKFEELECTIYEDKKYLDRNVSYPFYNHKGFDLKEEGTFKYDPSLKAYDDRYMHLDFLKIFPKDSWEIDANEYISKLVYKREKIDALTSNTFRTYELKESKTGFLEFELEAKKDSKIHFIFDELNTNGEGELIGLNPFRNTTHNVVTYELKKGHYHHIFFEPYTIKYLRVVVEEGEIDLKLLEFILYENSDVSKVKFKFNDEKVQAISEAAVSTFAQNSVDILTDCPSRERAGWLFDSFLSSQAEYLMTGDNKVERNFLENYALYKRLKELPEGMIPMCYPADFPDKVYIPNWSMFYIMELKANYERTLDEDLKNMSLDKVRGLVKFFTKYENEFGLLENLESWVMIEWSKANEYVNGVNIPSNMLYCEALRCAAYLLDDDNLLEKAKRLKDTINKYAFNGKFYVDNMVRNENNELVLTNNITETCQYYAFYFNICDKESRKELYNILLRDFGPTRDYLTVYKDIAPSNVIMGDFMRLFILLRDNLIDECKNETIDYFYKMAKETQTLWEHDSICASLNHGLTGVVLNIICEMYFGLKKINYVTKDIYLSSSYLNLEGEISIEVSKDQYVTLINKDNKVMIDAPEGYKIHNL